MNVEIKDFESRSVVGIRRQIPRSEIGNFIPEAFGTVGPFINSEGLTMTGPPVAIYYSVIGDEVDMAAGAPVMQVTAASDQIVELELPGGKKATTVHVGPYGGLANAWDAFIEDLKSQGHAPGMPCWEEYLTDPRQESDSSKWQTMLVEPIE